MQVQFLAEGEDEGEGEPLCWCHPCILIPNPPQIRSPSDGWLWRLATCAGGGSLTNIRPDGSASMGLHGDPDLLTRDHFSADFGVGFYGHWKNAGSYLTCLPNLGWVCFGCDLESVRPPTASLLSNQSACDLATEMTIKPRDAFRRR